MSVFFFLIVMEREGKEWKKNVMEVAEKKEENEGVSDAIEKKNEEDEVERIQINRAALPVLWAMVATEREGYSYEEYLSFWKAIDGIISHSKG